MSGFSPYLLLGIETDVVPEKCFNFCFTEGIMEKVMQINDCRSKYSSSCTHGYMLLSH